MNCYRASCTTTQVFVFADDFIQAAQIAAEWCIGKGEEIANIELLGEAANTNALKAGLTTKISPPPDEGPKHGVLVVCTQCYQHTLLTPSRPIECAHCGSDHRLLHPIKVK